VQELESMKPRETAMGQLRFVESPEIGKRFEYPISVLKVSGLGLSKVKDIADM